MMQLRHVGVRGRVFLLENRSEGDLHSVLRHQEVKRGSRLHVDVHLSHTRPPPSLLLHWGRSLYSDHWLEEAEDKEEINCVL